MNKQESNQESNQELLSILQEAVYIGCKPESIQQVIDYCRARNLDPLQKPVHIVPRYNAVTKRYEDTIMPGIGMYRIQAMRDNAWAGSSEPEYGPTIKQTFIKVETNQAGKILSKEEIIFYFPEWCKITIQKIVGNHIGNFVAKEYWLENYATLNRHSTAPNAMWAKRPFGQLAKCTEAQVLRKAFSDTITQQPTAEEMEGKLLLGAEEQRTAFSDTAATCNTQSEKQAGVELSSKKENSRNLPKETPLSIVEKYLEVKQESSIPPKEIQLKTLKGLIEEHNVRQEVVNAWLEKAQVKSLDDLPHDKINKCIQHVKTFNQVKTNNTEKEN